MILILGRQFQYDRALEIIQEEEYLEDADADEIKRHYHVNKVGSFNSDFIKPKNVYYGEWKALQNKQILFKRDDYIKKKQNFEIKAEKYTSYSNKNGKEEIVNESYKIKRKKRVKRQSDIDGDGVQDINDNCPKNNLISDSDFTGSDTYEFSGSTSAKWNIQKNSISQTANCCGALAIGKAQFTSVEFNGKMRTTSDDDWIGFVFAFQDIQNFYVFYARRTNFNLPWRLVQAESTNVANLRNGMKFILNE